MLHLNYYSVEHRPVETWWEVRYTSLLHHIIYIVIVTFQPRLLKGLYFAHRPDHSPPSIDSCNGTRKSGFVKDHNLVYHIVVLSDFCPAILIKLSWTITELNVLHFLQVLIVSRQFFFVIFVLLYHYIFSATTVTIIYLPGKFCIVLTVQEINYLSHIWAPSS